MLMYFTGLALHFIMVFFFQKESVAEPESIFLSSLSQTCVKITHNATQPPTVHSEIWLHYASSS